MATYAIADLHGRYDLWKMIDNFTNDTDKIYVLGDCGDRGPEGWRLIKEVYNSPKTIMLKGNHEDMLVDAMKEFIKYPVEEQYTFFNYSHSYHLCYNNGGGSTFRDWGHEKNHRNSWIRKLDELPTELIYLNKRGQRVVLTHAGYTPHLSEIPSKEDYLWDRYHFNQMWDEDYADTIMVHGHTPIPYMDEYLLYVPAEDTIEPGAMWYSEDNRGNYHKVNIDSGAVFTGYSILLNLDTWEQILFVGEDCVYKKDDFSGNFRICFN